jgi:hypothetical protein
VSNFKILVEERDARLAKHIAAGLSDREIADREGLQPDYVNKRAKKLGLAKPSETTNEGTPFGLSPASRQFRNQIGNRLYNWAKRKELHHLEVGHLTGIPMRHQLKATNGSPRKHNWTLAQIDRFAKASGIDFTKLLILCLEYELKEQAGANRTPGQLVDEWLKGDKNV